MVRFIYKQTASTTWNISYYYYFEVSHFIPAKHTSYTSAAQTAIYRADDNGMKAAFATQQGWGGGDRIRKWSEGGVGGVILEF